MIGEDFKFNNIWLSDFGMKMYDPEESQKFVSRNINKSNQTPIRSVPNHYSVSYSDVLTLSFLIMKDECACENQKEFHLSSDELNDIRSWLESPKLPCELNIQSSNNEKDVCYFGIFTDVQPFEFNKECYGLYLTFTCNAPYGFSPLVTKEFKINGTDGTFTADFPNLSAEQNEYLMPQISIVSSGTFSGNEQISISNKSDDGNSMDIKLPSGCSEIVIDCRKKTITDELGRLIPLNKIGILLPTDDENSSYYNILSAESFSIYWLRFLYGENNIAVKTENAKNVSSIKISGRYIVKAGGF